MSKPEPPPKDEGYIVSTELIKFIRKKCTSPEYIREKAIELIKERDCFGYKKYGQHLRTKDGRDDIEDARQEIGDLMQYLFKAKMNYKKTTEISELVLVLMDLINNEYYPSFRHEE